VNLAIVCVAGGRGERFGGDKLAERIGSRTVLETALAALDRAFPTAPLIVAVPPSQIDLWRGRIATTLPGARVVAGGGRRQDSVRAGVILAEELGADVVAIHDGARPLIDPEDAREVVRALGDAAGAVLCARIDDTVKRVDGSGLVAETVPRDSLRLAQTPQVFRVAALAQAWELVDTDRQWTDEAAMLETIAMPVRSVVALRPNPKLTTPDDLLLIRALAGGGA
jgi:2-C-methyl-D-erythritol 4-phosphate cytidylyltransferase